MKRKVRKAIKTAEEIANYYFPKDAPHHTVIMSNVDFTKWVQSKAPLYKSVRERKEEK